MHIQTASERFDIINRLKRANECSLVVMVFIDGKNGPFTGKIVTWNEKRFDFSIKMEDGEQRDFRVPTVMAMKVIADELYGLFGTVQNIRYIEADGESDSACGTVIQVEDGKVAVNTFPGVEMIQLSDIWEIDSPEEEDCVPWEP